MSALTVRSSLNRGTFLKTHFLRAARVLIRGEGQLVVVLQAAQKSYSDVPGFDGLVPGNSVYYTSRWRRTQHIVETWVVAVFSAKKH